MKCFQLNEDHLNRFESWIQDHSSRIMDRGSRMIQDLVSWIEDPGSRGLDSGSIILDPRAGSGSRILDPETFRIHDPGFWIQASVQGSGSRNLDSGSMTQDPGARSLIRGRGCRILVPGSWIQKAGFKVPGLGSRILDQDPGSGSGYIYIYENPQAPIFHPFHPGFPLAGWRAAARPISRSD